MKIKWTDLVLWIVGTELIGSVSALFSGGNFSGFYNSLEQPPFSPPGWLFPVMWAILYGLMGISAYLIQRSDSPKRKGALSLYWAQLFVNFIWTPVFFGLRSLSGAAVVVVVLLVLVITMTAVFYQIEKKSAYLNIPYILWTAFASYLTIGVLLLNRQIS